MKPAFTKSLKSTGVIVVLLSTTILFGSWKAPMDSKTIVSGQDTTKSSKKKSAQYSRKSIITFDEKGVPHEEVTENFEGDEELKEMIGNNSFHFNMPDLPDMPTIDMPDFPNDIMPGMPPDFFEGDTLENKRFRFNEMDFKGFNEQFEAMMEERFESFGPPFETSMEHLREQLAKMDFEFDHQLNGLNKNLEEEMSRLSEAFENLDLNLDNLNGLDEQLNLNFNSESWEERVKEFEAAAQKELVKDGYLKNDEKIESISWSDSEIKFNNKTVKPEHTDKYRDLREKSLNREMHRGRPE